MHIKTTVTTTAIALSVLLNACKKEDSKAPANYPESAPQFKLCMYDVPVNSWGIVDEPYAQEVSLFNGDVSGTTKTATGYYRKTGGLSIHYDLTKSPLALSTKPFAATKVTFVHAFSFSGQERLVSVRDLPGASLFFGYPYELSGFLAPTGYTVEHYVYAGNVHSGTGIMDVVADGFMDSIVISGPAFQEITIGANLNFSELRSICFEIHH